MRYVRSVVAVLSVLVFIGLASARDAKPTRVVLTLKDGKTVSGELIEATPAGVTLKPNPKADLVVTPWAKIKLAGGGLSRQVIVDEWRKSKSDELCETCTGSATTQCAVCEGTGVDPAQKQACEKCEGTGSTGKCKTPKCDDGMIPCPNTCLKADMFTGAPDPADGKRKKFFRGKDGTNYWWSEGHIGELIVFENGTPVNKGRCPRCDGTSHIADPVCKGTGKTICVTCKGHGIVGPDCATCDDGLIACVNCGGTGLRPAAAPAVAPSVETPPTAPTN